MGTGLAIVASGLIGAGVSAVTAQQQAAAQGRLSREALEQQRTIAGQQQAQARRLEIGRRTQITAEQKRQKEADVIAQRLEESKVRDLRNVAAIGRNISPFPEISEAVLTDRASR